MKLHNVPFFSLEKQTKNLEVEITKRFSSLLSSQQFIGGLIIELFEKQLALYLKANYAISCNSGTDAIWLALKAFNVQKNSIVLTTPFSFIASASEILKFEAHPAFIDIDETSLTISPVALQSWLELNTIKKNNTTIHRSTNMPVSGIIAVDLFGLCADYIGLKAIAREWNLWIIEDACQAIGSRIGNAMAGTLGDIAAISFYPTKNLGAFGDAGACSTNRQDLAEQILKLRNHGRKTHYDYEELGINSRMDCIQAEILSEKLKHLDSFNTERRKIASYYNNRLSNSAGITIPQENESFHVYHQYGIRLETKEFRDKCMDFLQEHGIGTRVFYPMLLSAIPFLQTHPALVTVTPVAQKTVDTILCLPIWPELTQEDTEYVCDIIEKFAKKNLITQPLQPTAAL